MEQRRLLLAFVLSAVILFGWSYLFPTPSTQKGNGNNPASPRQVAAPSMPSEPVVTSRQSPGAEPTNPTSPTLAGPPTETVVITGPALLIILFASCLLALLARRKVREIERLKLKKGVSYHFLKHTLEFLTILIIASLVYTALWMFALIAANRATLRSLIWLETSLARAKSFYGSYLRLSALQTLLVISVLYFLGLRATLSKWAKGYQTWSKRVYVLLLILCSFSLFGVQRGEATLQDLRLRIVLVRQGYADVRQKARDVLSAEAADKVYEKIRDSFPQPYRNVLESHGQFGARAKELRGYYSYAQGQYEVKSGKAETVINEAARRSAAAEAVTEVQPLDEASGGTRADMTVPDPVPDQINYVGVKEAQAAVEERERALSTRVITFLKGDVEGGKELVLHLPKIATGTVKNELFSSWIKAHPVIEPLVDVFVSTLNDKVKAKLEPVVDRLVSKIIQRPDAAQAAIEEESSQVTEQVVVDIPLATLEKASQAGRQLENDLASVDEAKMQIESEIRRAEENRIEDLITQLRSPSQAVSERASTALSKAGEKISKTQIDELIGIMRHGGQSWRKFLNREGHCDYYEYTSVRYYAASALESMKSPYVDEATEKEAATGQLNSKTTERITDPGWI